MTQPEPRHGLIRTVVPPAVSLALHSTVLLTIVALGARDRAEYLSDDGNLSDVTSLSDDPTARRSIALDPPAPEIKPADPDPTPSDIGTPDPTDQPAHATDDPQPEPVDLTGLSTTLATVETGSILAGGAAPDNATRIFASTPGGANRPAPAASFAGLRSQAASKIVYAVDASGAVVSSFTFLQEKLVQSIDRLGPAQRFNVVFFHDVVGRDESEPPYSALSGDQLTPAIPGNQAAAAAWIESIAPAGRSDPLDGLRPALAMKPDVVFLLSTSIPRTNAEWGAGRDAILEELDRLNPVNRRTGKRPVVIKTIQFLREDPSGLMRDIAMIHGDGEGSHRTLTVDQLRDEPDELPEVAVDPTDPNSELVLAAAAARLGTAERDGSVLAALYAAPLPDQRHAAETAARESLELLSRFENTTDLRTLMLRARAAIILAMLTPDERTRTALARTALTNAQNTQLTDPKAETARRITRLLALSLLGEHEAAARDARELVEEIARTDPAPADLAEPVLAWARVAHDGVSRSEAADAIASVARAQTLDSDPLWAHTLAVARARLALSADPPSARAFDEILALLDRDDLIADDTARRSMVFSTISAVAEGRDLDWPRFPAQATFAHAIDLGRSVSGRAGAIELLVRIADNPAAGTLRPEALWEAAILRRLDNTAIAQRDASTLLARRAREHPESPRGADALAAAINEPRATDGELPESFELDLVKRAIESFPDRPEIDIWRIDYAKRVSGMARLDALEPVAPGTRQATLAADLYFPASRSLRAGASPTQRLALLERAVAFARRHAHPEWAPLAADLAEEAAESNPATSARLAGSLLQSPDTLKRIPGGADRMTIVNARAKRALGDDAGAFELVRDLATRLEASPDRPRAFWHAWTIMLEILADRADDASRTGARAHLARLRILDPNLGGPPFESRLSRVADSLDSAP